MGGFQNRGTDSEYLMTQQYQDAGNLGARQALHQRFAVNSGMGWYPWVAERLLAQTPAAARLLEVGAGPGTFWGDQQDRTPADWRVVLTDLSSGMVATARERLAPDRRFAYGVVDAGAIPFPEQTFDGVIANHMLYHVPDLPQALREIRRVLKPGGWLLAATNGRDHLIEIWQLIERFAPAIKAENVQGLTRLFRLETGGADLAAVFERVERYDYDDGGLRVNEVEPLVAYVYSMPVATNPALAGQREAFTAFVAGEMARQHGVIAIRRMSGVFVAKRPA